MFFSRVRIAFLIFSCITCLASPLAAQIYLDDVRIDPMVHAQNLNIPWEMEWGGNNDIFFTELEGDIKRLDLSTGTVTVLYTIPDVAREGQAGLMGMALHPDFPNTPEVFVAHSFYTPTFDIQIRILRLEYDATNEVLINPVAIVDNIQAGNTSTGCRILIGSDQNLWVTLGDLDNNELAQETDNPNGKVHRFELDGSIPLSNPFGGSSIYSFGHRNPQGLAEGPNGILYSSEHGPFSNDELNVIESGRNYGWPLVSGFCTENNADICEQLDVREPMQTWTPTVAPGGMDYYNGAEIAEWSNSLLIAGLKAQHVNVVKLSSDGTEILENRFHFGMQFGRIRDILVTPDHRIFVATSNTDVFGEPGPEDDQIIELIPSLHNGLGDGSPNETVEVWVQGEGILIQQQGPTKQATVTVWDLTGKELMRETINNTQMTLPTAQLSQGLYLLGVKTAVGLEMHKIYVP